MRSCSLDETPSELQLPTISRVNSPVRGPERLSLPRNHKDLSRSESFRKVFPVELEADKTYQFDLRSRDFDTYLRLEDNTGRQVAFNDDANGRLDSQIVFTPQQGGKYRVVATTFRDGATGAFVLNVKPAAKAAMPAAKAAMPAAKATAPVLGVWEVKGRDTKIWTATMVLRQPRAGVLEGHFDWRSAGGESGGREHFQGTYDLATGLVLLQGVRLENARGIALGCCVAAMSADGREMREGVWGGPFAQSGIWSAVLQQPEQAGAAAPAP